MRDTFPSCGALQEKLEKRVNKREGCKNRKFRTNQCGLAIEWKAGNNQLHPGSQASIARSRRWGVEMTCEKRISSKLSMDTSWGRDHDFFLKIEKIEFNQREFVANDPLRRERYRASMTRVVPCKICALCWWRQVEDERFGSTVKQLVSRKEDQIEFGVQSKETNACRCNANIGAYARTNS